MTAAKPASTTVRTPCIGICSTVFGDHVCRGCKRYAHEVIDWNGYSNQQKALVEARLSTLLSQVLADKVRIRDVDRLTRRLERASVRYSPFRTPECWLLELLRSSERDLVEPMDWGFEVLSAWLHLTLGQLLEHIDDEFFRLSEAHYQRYIQADRGGGASWRAPETGV